MSTEVPTTRDIIATGLHQLCVDRWNQFDGASTRHGVEVHHTTADAAVAALAAAGKTIVDTSHPLEDLRDDEGNYLGKQGTTHEHRTVGDYRAWCYDAHEWCYPSDACHLCKEMSEP